MEAKKISVIIPTYNRKEKLPACVDSVLAQTYQNIEVLEWMMLRRMGQKNYSVRSAIRE